VPRSGTGLAQGSAVVAPVSEEANIRTKPTQAVARAVEALSLLGYDVVVVPRNASVTVIEAPAPKATA